jgi:ATP-dependent Lon protease
LPAFHSRDVRSSSDAQELRLPSLRVLVLEDEPLLAAGLQLLLRQEGHEVVVVTDSSQVAPTWREHLDLRHPFDVALLDLVQPTGQGGEAALAALRAEDPTAHAVVMSGYAESGAMSEHEAHGFQARLAKPFDLPALRRALHGALVAAGALVDTPAPDVA